MIKVTDGVVAYQGTKEELIDEIVTLIRLIGLDSTGNTEEFFDSLVSEYHARDTLVTLAQCNPEQIKDVLKDAADDYKEEIEIIKKHHEKKKLKEDGKVNETIGS